MTRWEVVGSGGDAWGNGRTYSVVRVNADGSKEEVRARWSGLSCIDAQVIAAELTRAYELGAREVFAEPLSDLPTAEEVANLMEGAPDASLYGR